MSQSKLKINKHKWERAWEDKKFSIKTLSPSILVSKFSADLREGDRVLDVGCGNGRNSIYLANKKCWVDCFDVIDLGWQKKMSPNLQDKIHFKKSDILKYHYKHSNYSAIIITRVIQYLNKKELNFLIDKIKYSLCRSGFVLLNYNTKGGIFDKDEIDVPKYSYSIEYIKKLLNSAFRKVIVSEGSKKSKHVNYDANIFSYDIYASDPKYS